MVSVGSHARDMSVKYDEKGQTAAEWLAFSGPALAAGGASECGTIAKQANGCRVVLVFRIAQKADVLQGFRARRDVDFQENEQTAAEWCVF